MFIVIVVLLVTMINGADIISKEIVKETDNYKLWESTGLGNAKIYVFEVKKDKSLVPNDLLQINENVK